MARKINFGPHKGKTVEDLLKSNPGFLSWALKQKEDGKVKGGPLLNLVNSLTPDEIKQLKGGDNGTQTTTQKSDGKTQIQISCVNDKGSMIFTFYGLDKKDAFDIRSVLHNNPQKYTQFSVVKDNTLKVKISTDDLDNFLNTGMKTIQSILLKSNRYDQNEIMHLEDEAYARAGNGDERGNKVKAYKDNKNKAIEVWQKYLGTLDDPETVKIIEAYSVLPLDKVYGHQLSQKNAMLIRSVNNDATFILPLGEWRKLNRGVKRNAQRYVIYIIPKGTAKSDINKVSDVIKSLGWGSSTYDELPPQVQKEVDIKTNNLASKIFIPVYEYDIADTYVFPGKPDLFNQTMGLKNNLTGELNALAKMDAMSNPDAPKPDEIMRKRTIEVNEKVNEICEKNKVKYLKSDNPAINIVNALEANYRKSAEKLDILKETNIKMFAENATHITLLIGKFAYEALNRFSHGYRYTKKEVGEMINAVGGVLREINIDRVDDTSLNEAININTDKNFIKQFMDAFFEIGCRIVDDSQKPAIQQQSQNIDRIVAESIKKVLKKKELNEVKRLIDNFDAVEKFFNTNDNDKFYFVQIIKRFKDNPNMDKTGNYHAGGEYLQSWNVFSYDELLKLKPEIINACETQNARAYMTVNPRSQNQIKAFVSTFRRRFKPTDPRYIHAEEILAGQTKGHWDDRPILFLDIDTTDKRIHNDVSEILKRFGIDELFRYTTPNGGLHIVLPNKDAKYMKEVIYLFNKYDNYRNKGRLATVHPNNDGKIILYSNVDAKGY